MFLTGDKFIDVTEVHKSFLKPYAKLNNKTEYRGRLQITPLRLSIAIARSLLTKSANNMDIIAEAFSKYIQLQRIIHTGNHNFKINSQFKHIFRDFSKTNRIGEIAQGLTYLLSQDILDLPIISDFNGFYSNFRGIELDENSSTPDYVATNTNTTKGALIESKGSMDLGSDSKLKKAFNTGLKQCKNGENLLASPSINKSFVAVSDLSTSTNKSKIQYIDPSKKGFDDEGINHNLIRYHYSNWFFLSGQFNQAIELFSNENITPIDNIEERSINNFNFIFFNSFPLVFNNFLYSFYQLPTYRFGILSKVYHSLTEGNLNFILPAFKDFDPEIYEFFSDGTVIQKKRDYA